VCFTLNGSPIKQFKRDAAEFKMGEINEIEERSKKPRTKRSGSFDNAIKHNIFKIKAALSPKKSSKNQKINSPGFKLALPVPDNKPFIDEDNVNEIIDQECIEGIENNLNKVWETANKRLIEDLEKVEEEMEKFLDNIAEEKFKKTMEINNKFAQELRELEDDVDHSKLIYKLK
jgi:hypothetical protein